MVNFILGILVGATGLYIYRNGWNVFRVRLMEVLTGAIARYRVAPSPPSKPGDSNE